MRLPRTKGGTSLGRLKVAIEERLLAGHGGDKLRKPSHALFQQTRGNRIKNTKNSMESGCRLILKGEI